MKAQDITLCLTIGRRPELLRQTLESLFNQISFEHIIAINDFRDEETNQVFRELCPTGILINLAEQVGHHKAVDVMYAQVKTNYIFHCEDDWLFDQPIQIEKYINILKNDSSATSIVLRKLSDFSFTEEEFNKIQFIQNNDITTAKLTKLHDQWHGFTFNPHISPITMWKATQGFKNFKKERHISRWFRKRNQYNLFLKNGVCHHIGWENSLANPPKITWWQKTKAKVFG